jgi:hypothetical protein
MNVSNLTSVKNMAQEATETVAQTKTEAAKGDQQAIRKLAQQQSASNTQSAQQPANVVDSTKGTLDIKA